MYNFSGKIVVVTGGAQGLGATIAARFLAEQAEAVVLLDYNVEKLQETAYALDPEGDRTMTLFCNVAEESSVKEAFQAVYDRYGRVDILINNAGVTRDAFSHKMTAEQFHQVVQVSLYGAFYCVQQVVAGMREQASGRIISLSSLAYRGNPGQTNYSAAKAGIVGMTKTLALELGRKNITVNCVAPGMVNTDIIKTVPEQTMAEVVKTIPMGRIGEPEEVASVVAFLASDEASYVSGQCIKISGGLQ